MSAVRRGEPSGDGIVLDTEAVKHQQVRRYLLEMIESLSVGDRLPPERELAARFGVSRVTLRQAVSSLAQAGCVIRRQGAGTFVADATISKRTELRSFSEEMVARGLHPSSRAATVRRQSAGASVGAQLGLSPADEVLQIRRIRLADGIPICLETTYLPCARFPGLEEKPMEGSLYAMLANDYGLELADAAQTIRATVVDADTAAFLQIPVFSAALVVTRLGRDAQQRPVEYTISVYRGDRYEILQTVTRT